MDVPFFFPLKNLQFFEHIKYFSHFTPYFVPPWTVPLGAATPPALHLNYASASGRVGFRNLFAPGPIFGSCEDSI
jgi:hypothetical protein